MKYTLFLTTALALAFLLAGCGVKAASDPAAGAPPAAPDHRAGCPFAGRCALTLDQCWTTPPPQVAFGANHMSRCHRAGDVGFVR